MKREMGQHKTPLAREANLRLLPLRDLRHLESLFHGLNTLKCQSRSALDTVNE